MLMVHSKAFDNERLDVVGGDTDVGWEQLSTEQRIINQLGSDSLRLHKGLPVYYSEKDNPKETKVPFSEIAKAIYQKILNTDFNEPKAFGAALIMINRAFNNRPIEDGEATALIDRLKKKRYLDERGLSETRSKDFREVQSAN